MLSRTPLRILSSGARAVTVPSSTKAGAAVNKRIISQPWSSTIASRAFTTSPTRLEGSQTFKRLVGKRKNWESGRVNLAQLLEDLRQLQSLEVIIAKESSDASVEYRDAERALYGLSVSRLEEEISLGEISNVLPDVNGRAWTAIFDRAFKGSVDRLQAYDEETMAAALFSRVYNIGPRRAIDYAHVGARTLEDLKKLNADKKIKLFKAQELGLEHLNDVEKLIPREEIENFLPQLEKVFRETDPELKFEILGSFRRQNKFASDIDIVATHPRLKRGYAEEDIARFISGLIDNLKKAGIFVGKLAEGKVVFRGLAKLAEGGPVRRMDITFSAVDCFAYRVLGFTGDERLMKVMRNRAKDMDLFLNNEGLGPRVKGKGNHDIWDYNNPVPAETEEDIFKALKMDYIPPHERNFKTYKHKINTSTK